MSREHPLVRVRVPPEILQALETSRFINRRSLTSEIVFGLEQYLNSIEATKKASGPAVGSKPDASHHHE